MNTCILTVFMCIVWSYHAIVVQYWNYMMWYMSILELHNVVYIIIYTHVCKGCVGEEMCIGEDSV